MSRYLPLKRHLEQQTGAEAPMGFAEIEKILGFRLPDSARSYPAWWSNHVGTHVNAAAWRDAGWKTARLDLAAERVTFVRDNGPRAPRHTGVSEGGSVWEGAATLPLYNLSRTAQRMIEDWAEETGTDRGGAASAILEAVAMARRRQLLDSLPVAVMPPGWDSTEIIRADRDRR